MRSRWRTIGVLLLAGLLAQSAAAQTKPEIIAHFGSDTAVRRLLVRGTTDVALFAPVLTAFVAATPDLGVDYEQWGSNELYAVSMADCGGAGVPADLVISSAVDQQVKLVNDGCAQPHRSARTDALPASANWRNEVFGITLEPAVIVYNRDLVPAAEAPASRFDLIDLLRPEKGRYSGKVATYDIEQSGLGYLFAFADSQQATTFGSLIEAFGRSGAVATCCSVELIDGVAEGRYLIAYNVLGSYARERAAKDPRIAIVTPADYTLVLMRAAMIPKAAANPAAAAALIDFMLSDPGRRALTETGLQFPFEGSDRSDLRLPRDDNSLFRPIPLSPALLLGLDQQTRAHFLERWRKTFPVK